MGRRPETICQRTAVEIVRDAYTYNNKGRSTKPTWLFSLACGRDLFPFVQMAQTWDSTWKSIDYCLFDSNVSPFVVLSRWRVATCFSLFAISFHPHRVFCFLLRLCLYKMWFSPQFVDFWIDSGFDWFSRLPFWCCCSTWLGRDLQIG